jgi:hypothetical protein
MPFIFLNDRKKKKKWNGKVVKFGTNALKEFFFNIFMSIRGMTSFRVAICLGIRLWQQVKV